ncbi:TadE family protein [Massilia sp. METH4]|uniref:TadE/TadG family type IV pilus assembly protein n=1 Tax=Massilia sp. METH4 TaxID=3123041 RepID=UPI0030D215A5
MFIKRRQTGATLVEMAFLTPVFLLVLMALVEFGMMFFVTLTMQYAVREGARYAITGQSDLDPAKSGKQRSAAVIQKIRDSSMGMYDKVGPVIVVNDTKYESGAYGNATFGTAGDLIVLRLNCAWTVTTPIISAFFADGKYRFAVAATMRNEDF